jgi:phosphoribosylaminoimidazole-succinocarboxamide synthase
MIEKTELLYEGKAKKIFRIKNDPSHYLMHFKDDLTAFNKQEHAIEEGKGALNCKISCAIFRYLNEQKPEIKNQLVRQVDNTNVIVKATTIFPIEVVVRNIATGSLVRRLGVEDGLKLQPPLLEWFYKDDELGDPLISERHILCFNWMKQTEIDYVAGQTLLLNQYLLKFFDSLDLNLVDFKVEFGKDNEGNIFLIDEITPDTCRIWRKIGGEKLDKDRFRLKLGNVLDGYQEVYSKIQSTYPEYCKYDPEDISG